MGKTPIMATAIVTPAEAVPTTTRLAEMPSSSPSATLAMTSSPPEAQTVALSPSMAAKSPLPSLSSPKHTKVKIKEEPQSPDSSPSAPATVEDSKAAVAAATAALASGYFTWDNYLLSTGAKAAKTEWFFQSRGKLINNFIAGHKLVVPDPRGLGTECLATIIKVYTAWICVRLDGEDSSNDHWVTCDDSQLCPVRDHGEGLQPPVGFTRNPSNFRTFLNKQLNLKREGKSVLCPDEWFTPIDSSLCPATNHFVPGTKCEIIERRSFSYASCAVTVAEVNGDMLTLSFDGSSDHVVKEHFQSRYIYPCGWAEENGSYVVPPAIPQPKRQKRRSNLNGAAAKAVAKTVKEPKPKRARLSEVADPMYTPPQPQPSSSAPPLRVEEENEQQALLLPNGGIKQELISEEGQSQPTTPSDSSTQPASSSGLQTPNQEIGSAATTFPPASIETSSTPAVVAGEEDEALVHEAAAPVVEPVVATPASPLPVPVPVSASFPISVAAPVVSTPASSPNEPKKPKDDNEKDGKVISPRLRIKMAAPPAIDTNEPSTSHGARAEMAAFAALNKDAKKCTDVCIVSGTPGSGPVLITVQINYGCALGSKYLDMRKVMDMPRRIGPTTAHHVLREVIQGICNATLSKKMAYVFHKIPVGNSRYLGVTVLFHQMTYVRYLPCPSEMSSCLDVIRSFMAKLNICQNFVSTNGERCTKCRHYLKRAYPAPEYHSWSVQKMADYVAEKVSADLRPSFIYHELDGSAMSLLNLDLIHRYMSVSAGQAAKILDLKRKLESVHSQQMKSFKSFKSSS